MLRGLVSAGAPRTKTGRMVRRNRLTISKTKVLEVDICTRIELSGRLDEGIDEFFVLLAANSLLAETKVEVVFQEALVVSAAVEHDGQRPGGMDAGT